MLFILLPFYFLISEQKSNNHHEKKTSGSTVCPETVPQPGAIDPSEGETINKASQNSVQQLKNVEIGSEPDCDSKPMHEQRKNPPQTRPSNGNPTPTDEQRKAPRPESYNSDLQKLIILGYSNEKAENALLAADFNLAVALRMLQGH